MTIVAASELTHLVDFQHIAETNIAEDSAPCMFLGMVPCVGLISNLIQENALLTKISETEDEAHKLRLFKVLNQYRVSAIARDGIQMLVPFFIVLKQPSFASWLLAAGIYGFTTISLCYSTYRFKMNKKIIEILELNNPEDAEAYFGNRA